VRRPLDKPPTLQGRYEIQNSTSNFTKRFIEYLMDVSIVFHQIVKFGKFQNILGFKDPKLATFIYPSSECETNFLVTIF